MSYNRRYTLSRMHLRDTPVEMSDDSSRALSLSIITGNTFSRDDYRTGDSFRRHCLYDQEPSMRPTNGHHTEHARTNDGVSSIRRFEAHDTYELSDQD